MLRIKSITKTFGTFRALNSVDLNVKEGEVHVLFGENGAGKSTLINILVGNLLADEGGQIEINGERVSHYSPHKARELGIGVIYQEFSLVPTMSVLDNLFLGRELSKYGKLNREKMRREATEAAERFGFALRLDQMAGELPRAEQQLVEITKALLSNPRILILDEPTASLSDSEADHLLELVKQLRSKGVAVIYVSHRIREIRELADRVTVLRGGEYVGTVQREEITEERLVEMMTGRRIDALFPKIQHAPQSVFCEIQNLSSKNRKIKDVSLSVRAGEIVGVAGLVGCGKGEVGRALFGLDPIDSGKVVIAGERIRPSSARQMLGKRVCYFPADRNHEGLALGRSVAENVTMAGLDLDRFSRFGFLRPRNEHAAVHSAMARLALRPMSLEGPVNALSGGNRQKVMLGRGLIRDVDLFIFDEPTVGIDVGAKVEVYDFMKEAVERGAAVLLISSELPEVLALSNRVYVMHQGEIVTHLEGEDLTQDKALHAFFGHKDRVEDHQ